MSLIEMMENRRSVRAFNSEPITDEELNKILQAAMLAPNGKGLKPWSFVTIRDEKTLRDLVNCRKGGAKMLETATAAIAVYSDSDVTDTFIEDYGMDASDGFRLGTGQLLVATETPSVQRGRRFCGRIRESSLGCTGQPEIGSTAGHGSHRRSTDCTRAAGAAL